jgi:hypothetical protein
VGLLSGISAGRDRPGLKAVLIGSLRIKEAMVLNKQYKNKNQEEKSESQTNAGE